MSKTIPEVLNEFWNGIVKQIYGRNGFFTYEQLTNLNTFLPHTIMNEIISKEYYYLEYYKVTYIKGPTI